MFKLRLLGHTPVSLNILALFLPFQFTVLSKTSIIADGISQCFSYYFILESTIRRETDREAGDQNADVSVALDSKGRQQLNVALRCLLPLRTFSPFRKYEPIGSSAKTQKIQWSAVHLNLGTHSVDKVRLNFFKKSFNLYEYTANHSQK